MFMDPSIQAKISALSKEVLDQQTVWNRQEKKFQQQLQEEKMMRSDLMLELANSKETFQHQLVVSKEMLADKEKQLADKKKQLADKEKQLADMEKQLANKEAKLKQMVEAASSKKTLEQQVVGIKKLLDDKESQVKQLTEEGLSSSNNLLYVPHVDSKWEQDA